MAEADTGTVLDWLGRSLVRDDWRTVPDRAIALYRALAPAAVKIAAAHRGCAGPVYANLVTGQVVPGDPPEGDWVLVKPAADGFLAAPRRLFDALQRPFGGPSPLAATLAGGLLGGGLGAGAGWLAGESLPPGTVDRRRLRRTLGLLGAGAGSTLGLGWTAVSLANPDKAGPGLSALVSAWPHQEAAAETGAEAPAVKAGAAADWPAWFTAKVASDTGAFYIPTIPVDAFNAVVWADVRHAPNPYGTKNPYGDNSQPLALAGYGTPPPVAATVAGLVAGTGAATGRPVVSPFQVARTAALAGGTGLLGGIVTGKILGALAGLSPAAQAALQRTGLWGGLLTGAVAALAPRR